MYMIYENKNSLIFKKDMIFQSHNFSSQIAGAPPSRGRGRGRGRGANYVPLSGGRKKIMSIRDQRRKEDVANALKMKEELAKEKESRQEGNK